jgi:hypothetical protein
MLIELQDGSNEFAKKEDIAQEEGDKPEEEVKQEEAPLVNAPAEGEGEEVVEETEEDLERKRKEE